LAVARVFNAGVLSLYLTRRTGWVGLLRLATAALFRKLNQAKNFEKYLVEEASIESPSSPGLVATDGEVNWMESPLHYRVRPNALRIIAPHDRTA
jgi:diacylglycerol kinase family enzyme